MSQLAALLAALILAGLVCFQLLLAAGMPLGHYAWGGAHRVLPLPLRIASVLATFIYLVAALVILEAANVTDLVVSTDLARNAVWALAGFLRDRCRHERDIPQHEGAAHGIGRVAA